MALRREDIDKFLNDLKQQRDELKVKLHLAKADVEDEWEKAEQKWSELRAKLKLLGNETKDVSRDIEEIATKLAKEIRRGYDRIRKLM